MPFSVDITKRLIDIFISVIVIGLFLPIGVIIAILIKIDSKGPVFYTQKRAARCLSYIFYDENSPIGDDTFIMYKFRTMVEDAESLSGAVNASENDPRVTRIGKILRHTRLDEIPNFINVLLGDMSVVGPRADRIEIYNKVKDEFPNIFDRVKFAKPGITGASQIMLRSNGTLAHDTQLLDVIPKNELKKPVNSFRYKLYYDFAYTVKLQSFWSFLKTDITIMLKTPYVMFIKRNVV